MEQWLDLELENILPGFNVFSSTFITFLLRHLLKIWSLLPHFVILILHHWVCDNSTMVTKMKGIYKGFKYITQIFVVKEEREMEISCPTDVKHVAHIGWDGPSGSGPTWMNEFKTAPDFSTSIGSLNERRDPKPMANDSSWSTQDFEEPTGSQATSNIYQSDPSGRVAHAHDRAHAPKKPKRKKIKSTSSPTKSSTRQPRAAKSKAAATYYDREAKPVAQVQQAQEIN